jgi:hypothetical protein
MRMCRSVSDGVQATGVRSNRTEGRIVSLTDKTTGAVPMILAFACSILPSGVTYGHVSKLVDNGHLCVEALP